MDKQPLLVHLVFHPASESARQLARDIHAALNDDPALPGLRMPTVFCAERPDQAPPADQGLERAARSFVVLLADTQMNIADEWCSFSADLWEACRDSVHRCVPFQLTADAWPLEPDRLGSVSFVRAFAETEEKRTAFVIRRIVTELCRHLHGEGAGGDSPGAPTRLFISHTKMDIDRPPEAVHRLTEYLKGDQPIKSWFDSGDIAGGSVFAQKIAEGIQDASLLCVLTNHYGSREWCRKEVLLAKAEQRPIVVVDAITDKEVRSFPYLGNLPLIRWDGDPEAVVDLVLKETLRHLHTQALLERQRQADDIVFTRPPELVTVIGLPRDRTVLYPEPPLGIEEIRELEKTGVAVTTPLERLTRNRPLQGRQIALSMSESTDIRRRGFDAVHLEAAMLELSRYLLVQGATLVYGGHLGHGGYTERLFELVRAHNRLEGIAPVDRIVAYIGWPVPLTDAQRSTYKYVARLKRVPRPQGVDEALNPDFTEPPAFPAERSPLHRYAWARGMTAMRELETKETAARIVLGGTFGATVKTASDGSRSERWYAGRIPGLLEEVILSVAADQPVFLVGAFGGVAGLVIDILNGEDRPEMRWEYQKAAPYSEELRDLYAQRGEPWQGYGDMIDLLRSKGVAGINPLLSEAEHRTLFITQDPFEMAELIIRGLGKLV